MLHMMAQIIFGWMYTFISYPKRVWGIQSHNCKRKASPVCSLKGWSCPFKQCNLCFTVKTNYAIPLKKNHREADAKNGDHFC